MRANLLIGAVLVVVLAAPGVVQASSIIYSTFGSGNSYKLMEWGIDGTSTSNPEAMAVSFSPPSNYLFNSASFAFATDISIASEQFLVALTNSSSGRPGSTIESFSVTVSGSSGAIYTVSSLLNPQLVSGTTYWLTVSPSTASFLGGWFANNQGITGFAASDLTNGYTVVSGSGWTTPAYSVSGTLSGGQVPEPASLLLLGAGLAALAAWRRKK